MTGFPGQGNLTVGQQVHKIVKYGLRNTVAYDLQRYYMIGF